MRVGVASERAEGERRVAMSPDVVKKLVAAGFEVANEAGAGAEAGYPDQVFAEAGAVIEADASAVLGSDVVFKVQPPALDEVRALRRGAVLLSFLQPATQGEVVRALAEAGVTAFSLELVPRISRAQSMDALSSQASLAGYKAVLIAANRLGKFFPMLMTAAGTIAPARVLIIGAGVAGLQAIATARRLGAVVEAYDVRPAVRDEVRSLGATFIELELEAQEGEGGYAKEQSEDFLRRQRELLAERVAAADVVVTTANVPGRRAPVLLTGEMVGGLRPGSVVVDLAAESGGNCELTQPGEVIDVNGVTIDGTRNIPATVPFHASQLFARNLLNLLLHLAPKGEVELDFNDEITAGCCVTNGGEIVSARAKEMMASS